MTRCSSIAEARMKWARVPRPDLPDALRNPSTSDEFDIALAVAVPTAEPICRDGQLVGWAGIGVKS